MTKWLSNFAAVLFLFAAGQSNAETAAGPFSVGERIEFDIYAAGLYMGSQVIELRSIETFKNREVYNLYGQTKASRFMNLFYKLDDKWLVYMDKEYLLPLWLEKDMWEGERKAYLVYSINQLKKSVRIENRTTGDKKWKKGENQIFDLFSLAYYYRQFPERFNSTFTFDFLEEGSLQTVQFKNEGEVEIRLSSLSKSDRIPAYMMKQVGGIGIEIYVSTDELRLPLKIVTPAKLSNDRKLNVEMRIERYTPGIEQKEIPSEYWKLRF
jgi:hypothetical protein